LSGLLGRGRAVAASVAAGCGDCGDPVEGGHDLDGPGPGFGQAESSAAATVMELCGDVEHPLTQGFRLGFGEWPLAGPEVRSTKVICSDSASSSTVTVMRLGKAGEAVICAVVLLPAAASPKLPPLFNRAV